MRRWVIAAAVLLLAALTAPGARAAEDYGFLGAEDMTSALPEEARRALDGEGIGDGGPDVPAALGRVLERGRAALGEIFRSALTGGLAALAAACVCSVASGLAGPGERGCDQVNLVGVFVILSAAAGGVGTMLGQAEACLEDMGDLSAMLLPVMASASAASGAAASGAAKYAASALFLNLLGTAARRLILPLISMFLAASAGEAAFGGTGAVAKLLARLIKQALTALALIFTFYLTATGLVASSADAAAVKVTKTAISALLPVVGGMVSDAADAVASGVGVIRSAAGALGLVATAAVCVLPFLRLTVSSLIYRACAALASTVADGRLAGLIDSIATAFSLMLALTGTETVMLLISIVAAVKTAI